MKESHSNNGGHVNVIIAINLVTETNGETSSL